MPTSSNNVFTTSRGWTNKCKRINFSLKAVIIPVILVLGSMFSCIPYKTIDFQIMRPAQIKLGTGIEKVEIHCAYCNDSSFIRSLKDREEANAMASVTFLHTLEENLQKSPLFPNTQFSILPSDSLLNIIRDLRSRLTQNGIVIILDSIDLGDSILVQRMPNSGIKYYNYAMVHKFGCHIYNLRDMQVIDNHVLHDTLFWPWYFSELEVIQSMPNLTDAIWDTGIKGGEAFAKYMAPYWTDQSRDFFYGRNIAFQNAYTYIQQNMLDSALNALQHDTKTKQGKAARIKNLHNSAVIYELKDDFVNASIMADSAYNLGKKDNAKEYAAKLRLRKLDKIALDWQLN